MILCGFILSCGYVSAQQWYTPITRPYNPQLLNFGNQRQAQVTYQKIKGETKSGHTAPFRIKYIDGRMQSIEYYQSYNGWCDCYAYSRTDKEYIADDYEQAYDFKVQPTYDSDVYYF